MPRPLALHSRQLLEQIIGTALDAFVVIDTDSKVIAWTSQASSLFGWTEAEALGQHIAKLIIPPALRDAHVEGMRRYLATGEARVLSRRIEVQAQCKDGRQFPAELSIATAEIDGRRIFSAAVRDITDVRRAREKAERMTAVIESTTDFVGFADPSGAALYINQAGRALIGMSPDQPLAGVSISSKYPLWASKAVRLGIQHAVAAGVWSGDSALMSGDGTEIPTSQVITAHKDAQGDVEFISTIIRDMTHRHEVEQKLRAMDQRKDEFLAMLAHELRNPLAPIATAVHILEREQAGSDRVHRTSQVIVRQVAHITKLLDDLLDVSRVTRGLIQIDAATVDLDEVADDALEQAGPIIAAREHHLEVVRSTVPLLVRGDKTRLVQVLVNLLTNAARYTPEGGRIDLQLHKEDGAWAVITVKDNGVGIPAHMQEQIFEIFTQGERSSDRSHGGLGLGLALVKSIVQLHGGSVIAESAGPGRGSKFTLRFALLGATS